MSCVHTHPDRVTHTQTHSRVAGSDIKHIHVPTSSHTHIYSEPTDSREAGSSVQLKLIYKPSTYRLMTTINPRRINTCTAGQLPAGFIKGGYIGSGVCILVHTQSGVKQGLQEQPRANKQEENSLITSGCAGGREGTMEGGQAGGGGDFPHGASNVSSSCMCARGWSSGLCCTELHTSINLILSLNPNTDPPPPCLS